MNKFLKGHSLITFANWAVSALVVIAVLFLGRDIVSFYGKQKKRPPERGKIAQTVAVPGFNDYSPILQKSPFGFSSNKLSSLAVDLAKAAPVVMPVVIGTIAGPRGAGYAVFADKAGNQDIFKVGDDVFGAGLLNKVEKDKVVINSGGRLVDVLFANLSAIEPASGAKKGIPAGVSETAGGAGYTINKERLHASLDNPKQIMTDARFLPNMVEGGQQGFVIKEVKNDGIYQNLGLLNNDVVMRINEFNISSPEAALQAMNALRGMDSINLDVIRNGQKMTLSYRIK
jgi:general secretion pathway protein C